MSKRVFILILLSVSTCNALTSLYVVTEEAMQSYLLPSGELAWELNWIVPNAICPMRSDYYCYFVGESGDNAEGLFEYSPVTSVWNRIGEYGGLDVSLSPDDSLIYAASSSGLAVYQQSTYQLLDLIETDWPVETIRVGPEGSLWVRTVDGASFFAPNGNLEEWSSSPYFTGEDYFDFYPDGTAIYTFGYRGYFSFRFLNDDSFIFSGDYDGVFFQSFCMAPDGSGCYIVATEYWAGVDTTFVAKLKFDGPNGNYLPLGPFETLDTLDIALQGNDYTFVSDISRDGRYLAYPGCEDGSLLTVIDIERAEIIFEHQMAGPIRQLRFNLPGLQCDTLEILPDTSIDFGSVALGDSSILSLELRNAGCEFLWINEFMNTENISPFYMTDSVGTRSICLAHDESYIIDIVFRPESFGDYNREFQFMQLYNGLHTINLRGLCDVNSIDETEGEMNLNPDDFILIYPNPTNSLLNLTIQPTNSRVSYSMYNILGEKMISGETETRYPTRGIVNIPVSKWSTGNYYLVVEAGRNLYHKKVVIIK